MRFTAERAVKLLFKLFLEVLNELRVENEENQENVDSSDIEVSGAEVVTPTDEQ